MIAVLPLGALEQHSLHLPLGTDHLIAEAVAEAVEQRMPDDILLLPTIQVGASDHHLARPGSVSIGTAATAAIAARQCLSLARSTGIRTFLLLNGHGGNQPAVRLALETIHETDADLRGFAVDYWAPMFDRLDRQGVARPEVMGHADVIETSILLALRPELVDLTLAVDDGYVDDRPGYLYSTDGIPERTQHGGVGDPRAATAELGELYFGAAVDGVVGVVQQVGA